MIQAVEIRNFQSLRHVEVELGGLTVIVGPTSSGKSAFTRAVRTLTSNQRGSAFITHGEKLTTITATTDKGTVTLTRGKSTADNAYTVIPADDPAAQRTYTKLGADTPEEVSAFLGIEAKDPINYAGQFDKPYLLDDTGGEVARVLGALTNVNVIFEGARESNRRKSGNVSTLRTRASDLEGIQAKLPQYRELKVQAAALDTAEQLISEATRIQRRIAQLTEVVEQQSIAENTISRLEPYLSVKIPDEQEILTAAAKLTSYRDALREQQAAGALVRSTQEALTAAQEREAALHTEYAEAVGAIEDGIAGWFAVMATITALPDGQPAVTLDEAIRVATLYIEETAKVDS